MKPIELECESTYVQPRLQPPSPFIIRPHHNTTCVDAAYCYRPSSVVCLSSVTLVSPAEMAELIEIPFRLRTRVDPGNHVLDGGPDPPHGKGQF